MKKLLLVAGGAAIVYWLMTRNKETKISDIKVTDGIPQKDIPAGKTTGLDGWMRNPNKKPAVEIQVIEGMPKVTEEKPTAVYVEQLFSGHVCTDDIQCACKTGKMNRVGMQPLIL